MDVEELAPDVRPAGGLGDPVASEQLVKAGIAVGVDDAGERLQMGPRMLALAVGRVAEQRRRRSRPGKWPLVADIDPQPPGLGLAGAPAPSGSAGAERTLGRRSGALAARAAA